MLLLPVLEVVNEDRVFAGAWFKAIAVSRRASIEHCELTGAIWTMQDNTPLHGRKLLIICVDSLSVLR